VINRNWEELKRVSNANIQRDKGIIHIQTRSIQCEGSFEDMKKIMILSISTIELKKKL
jgi:hypothetical protein